MRKIVSKKIIGVVEQTMPLWLQVRIVTVEKFSDGETEVSTIIGFGEFFRDEQEAAAFMAGTLYKTCLKAAIAEHSN